MKEIHIAHLYYDLLNLYGESGNIKALKKELENQGLKVYIHFLTIGDDFNLEKYDFVYIGAGTEENQKIVIPHLMKYKEIIKQEIENGKFYFITGNAINLFGKYILKDNKKIKTLNIFDFYSKEESFRMIDESIMKCDFIDKPIIGFQNQSTIIKNNKYSMFQVIKGIGSFPNSKTEGIKYKNFYGTYLIGPILVRNPELLKYIIKELIISKNTNFKFKKFDLKQNIDAYNKFISNYYQTII
jgi:hypothetical protein